MPGAEIEHGPTDPCIADVDGRWPSLTLSLTHLLDERGINQDTVYDTRPPAHDVIYTRPRTLSLILSGTF